MLLGPGPRGLGGDHGEGPAITHELVGAQLDVSGPCCPVLRTSDLNIVARIQIYSVVCLCGLFFFNRFLRCNLDAVKISCLKCTIQWVPVYLLSLQPTLS